MVSKALHQGPSNYFLLNSVLRPTYQPNLLPIPTLSNLPLQANLTKAMRWWKSCNEVDSLKEFNAQSISRAATSVRKVVRIKAVAGRGRKHAVWVEFIYDALRE